MAKRIWKFISGVKVTVWLIWAAIALMVIGSFYVRANKMGFNTLNHSLIRDWFREWGFQNLDVTWWFAGLIAILFLLSINAACCILDRLAFHWKRRRLTGTRTFMVKISPSIIHAFWGIMLLGHFASTSIGYRSRDMEFVSRPGQTSQYILPGEIEMIVGEPRCEFYSGPFAGSIRQCQIGLQFTDGESVSKEIAMAKPLFWNGFQIHMSQVMAKDQPAAFTAPEFQLLVKRDPGLRLIVIGFPILILFTLYFYIEEKLLKRRNHYQA